MHSDEVVQTRLSLLGITKEAAGEYGLTNAVEDVQAWLNNRKNTEAGQRSLQYFLPRAIGAAAGFAATRAATGNNWWGLAGAAAGYGAGSLAAPHIQQWLKDRGKKVGKPKQEPKQESTNVVSSPPTTTQTPAQTPPATPSNPNAGFVTITNPPAQPTPPQTPTKPENLKFYVRPAHGFRADVDMDSDEGQQFASRTFRTPNKYRRYGEAPETFEQDLKKLYPDYMVEQEMNKGFTHPLQFIRDWTTPSYVESSRRRTKRMQMYQQDWDHYNNPNNQPYEVF